MSVPGKTQQLPTTKYDVQIIAKARRCGKLAYCIVQLSMIDVSK